MDNVLLNELELKRQLMIKSGIENGLQSHETLQLSEQVDRLMNAFEERHYYDSVTLYGED
ncbi:aspartyl-phosphate phosphatase Spo0E family protein [Lysinibacillus sp. 2017]|uniref:aspartyl-phosphate phosphatase Spo0E family protein n=1 Tax=unclassified Lysinibacillus TaxID=2636778 RepID=UPI000D529460|nr:MULTISPECIES: aspartyl-phosphate phosphatase Spo0E family protein [unclassified Lysinibacillus]AWE06500.1 aspartyl-phosphate phosphatase Spo0E family protein [Lysinibacillus sp. 2017]TGN32233.1 aspartyl-phosphate phosphatase Spo0E family protein [Lysinibacillus sp. S2017]